MDWLLCAEVVPFLVGLSSGLLVVFVSLVVVEALKTWRGRSRVINLGTAYPRENVRGVRQRGAW